MVLAQRKASYIWGLDIVRFAAALMVVFFHLSWQHAKAQIGYDPGWVGVEIFFVISGFVIMGSAVGATPIHFLERRFARLYPTAIACAVVNYAVLVFYAHLALSQKMYVDHSLRALVDSMVLIKGPFLVSALWTLPIELAFYALVLVLLLGRWQNRAPALAAGLIVWSGLYLIPFTLMEYHIGAFHVPLLGYGPHNLTLLRHGCFFGVGILLWHALNRTPNAFHFGFLALGIVLCCVEIAGRSVEIGVDFGHPVDTAAMARRATATFLVAIAAVHIFSKTNNRLQSGPRASAVLRRMGLMTYPLYLMHQGVGVVAFELLLRHGARQGIALLAALALSLIASLLVVEAIEPWLRRWLLAALHPLLERLSRNHAVANTIGRFVLTAS